MWNVDGRERKKRRVVKMRKKGKCCPHVDVVLETEYPGRFLDVSKAPHATYRSTLMFCELANKPISTHTHTHTGRKGERKTALHWGQRKLLIAEIEFLTEYADLELPVLYVGAAPGFHIDVLVRLFPSVKFILVDPREIKTRPCQNIEIRREVFCDESARDIAKNIGCVNFVSDIRSADWTTHDEKGLEKEVWNDMSAQKRWHEILSPHCSMLKFRLPWNVRHSNYLKGVIMLPIWSTPTSTESRLVVLKESNSKVIQYDNLKYCNQMFYFQTRTRVSMYEDGWCYDCISEKKVLARYLEIFASDGASIDELSMYISKSLSCSRSIMDEAADASKKVVSVAGTLKTGDPSKLSWDSLKKKSNK